MERSGPRLVARSWPWLLAASVGLASASGCATYSERTELARAAVHAGRYEEGVEQLNKLLDVKTAEKLPDDWKKNAVLVVLERGTILQAMGLHELSARDYQAADKELEILDISRDAAGKIGKYIYSDSVTKYKASPTEKLSLNAMNMCNYLAEGKLSGAKVEAKRFTVMRKYMSDYQPENEHGAFGSYLAGFVYEREGKVNEALRYYDEALQEREFESLRSVIPRLARRGTYRTERLRDYLPPEQDSGFVPASSPTSPQASGDEPPVQRPKGTPTAAGAGSEPSPEGADLLVVTKVGRVPYKIPKRIPIGLAVGLAGTYITGNPAILEHSMFKFVVYPELTDSGSLFQQARVSVDGRSIPTDLATDLGQEIRQEYEELKPKIIGAAISRLIVRAAAAEGARAAGRQAEGGAGGIVGFLAAAALEGTMVALDKPDTRSWTTLPDRVFVSRVRLPPGAHEVQVTTSGTGGTQVRDYEVDLKPGGFLVLDVTTLR